MIFTLNYENRDLKVILCCLDQPDIYELEAKAAREAPAQPWSIWEDLLLSIKFDLQLTTARDSVPPENLWFMLRHDEWHDSDFYV